MNDTPAIDITQLVRRYGRADAVNGFDVRVPPGRCYGFFGPNGAGKTTTIKCLLNLLRPTSGQVHVFGMNPATSEVAVKTRLAYVPDVVAFYPWMTVRQTLDYCAAFRARWNVETERALLDQFGLDLRQKTSHLSKGQRTQLALITAICPEPELLVLDEPTSGLDPIVRREFIQTIIGAYQDADPGRRTVFVSTHLIAEFEGLIDEFTIIDRGRNVLTMEADTARERYQRIHARFATEPAELNLGAVRRLEQRGREIDVIVDGAGAAAAEVLDRLRAWSPESMIAESLTLEEIFVAALQPAEPSRPAGPVTPVRNVA